MDGTTVPSEVDSWKCLCLSFGTQSTELCEALASVAEQLCTENVDPKGVSSFVACRLIVSTNAQELDPKEMEKQLNILLGKQYQ